MTKEICETNISKFIFSFSRKYYENLLEYLYINKYENIYKHIHNYFKKYFPNSNIMDYETYLSSNPNMNKEDHRKYINMFLKDVDVNKYITGNWCKHANQINICRWCNMCGPAVNHFFYKINNFPLVTFSITTCKRYDLFEKTMNSFLNCCLDKHLIDRWICVDDNSSEEDRKKMIENYPFFEFVMKTFDQKGHAKSMNIILEKVNTPYLFHMEDDMQYFIQYKYITNCLEVLSISENYGQCCINKNYMEIPSDYEKIFGGIECKSPSGIWYREHEYCPSEQNKKDFSEKYGNCYSCNYWPHYSLRPSLIKTNVLKDIGKYNDTALHFEMEYANRYTEKGYKTVFFDGIYHTHIGRLTTEINDETKNNAYTLNDEKQFWGKEKKENLTFCTAKSALFVNEKLPIFVVNLDRRPDRMKSFHEVAPKSYDYTRYSAVDGLTLSSSPQLQRLFDGNDYNMKVGMVGCALSHIDLWINYH